MRWTQHIFEHYRYSRGGCSSKPCKYANLSSLRQAADSLTQHSASLRLSKESGDQCTLFLSMSTVSESGDERQSEALDGQILEAQPNRPRFSHSNPMASQWGAALRQVYDLSKTFDQCSVRVLHNQHGFEISCDVQIRLVVFHWIQWYIYQAYQVLSFVLMLLTSHQ